MDLYRNGLKESGVYTLDPGYEYDKSESMPTQCHMAGNCEVQHDRSHGNIASKISKMWF